MTQPTQQFDPQWMETIVRMVVERLRADASSSEQASEQRSEPPLETTRTLTSRVITLAQLRNELQGVRVLRVAKRALVTPAVIDELKDRQIRLERCDQLVVDPPTQAPRAHLPEHGSTIRNRRGTNEPTSAPQRRSPNKQPIRAIQIVTMTAPACVSAATTLGTACQTQTARRADSIRELVQFAREQCAPSSLTLIVSCDPLNTVWECHQQHVRSAVCRTAADASEAIDSFQAQAIVIDGRCGLSHELVERLARLRN